MGQYQYKITCELMADPASFIDISEVLEVSLPCINCQRDRRTIIFIELNTEGICTPRHKCKGFPGKLISRKIVKEENTIKITYLIDFDYEPFKDLKDGQVSNFKYGWARVSFRLRCLKCQKVFNLSSQENIGRPWIVNCKCGNTVYWDEKSPFSYEVISASP